MKLIDTIANTINRITCFLTICHITAFMVGIISVPINIESMVFKNT